MRFIIGGVTILLLFCSFFLSATLNGIWQYQGGIYNGKPQGPTKEYALQRRYDELHYQSYIITQDGPPEKYEGGDYLLKDDTCLETQTFSEQPSRLVGKTVRYRYVLKNDTLVLSGTLPTGMTVIEYWKKLK